MPTRAETRRKAGMATSNKDMPNQYPSSIINQSTKRKRETTSKKVSDPVSGGWDVLPHGLGKKGDLEEGLSNNNQSKSEADVTLPPKKRSRGKAIKNDDSVKLEGDGDGSKTTTEDKISIPVEAKATTKPTTRRGRANKTEPVTPKSSIKIETANPVAAELLQEARPKKCGVKANGIKTEEDVQIKDDYFEEEKSKKKRATRKKAVVASEDVLEKVNDLIDASGKIPKKERKKKHPYGLTPGYSPFPDHNMPTPEACEEVTRLLSELHGKVEPPKEVSRPSMEVTGCGEVPDLLDAVLRTRLSANTSSKNSNMALKGLKDTFKLRTSGPREACINLEAVLEADVATIIGAIKSGGLAKVKGTDIKNILKTVYERNLARRDALLKENETGESADVLGANHDTKAAKDAEIASLGENMLSMDHVFEMSTDEAMEELTKLPGIGVKTASCVILFCMKRPSFAVDTHVWRHCKWLGWIPEKATRDQAFSHCEVRIPDHLKYALHQLLIRHGKTCGRCKGAARPGSEEWNKTECPIEHLVTRDFSHRKGPGAVETKGSGKKGGKGKKGKKISDDEMEESEVEMNDDISGDDNIDNKDSSDDEAEYK